MREFARPVVVSSMCLEFKACRWNGMVIPDPFIRKLKQFAEFRPVCPECEIGLGVPREPVRVVEQDGKRYLMQSDTELDVTDKMVAFTKSHLDGVTDADGFILKGRSPSCGIGDVRIYPRLGKVGAIGRGSGLFGGAVVERFPHLAIENEGRLNNFSIREHFLQRVFLFAAYRAVRAVGTMKALVQFHSENKLLLTAYSQKELKLLGRIVANHEKRPVKQVIDGYHAHLSPAVAKAPRSTSNINVLMHGMGYFSKQLSSQEKAFFLDSLEDYRAGKVPLSVPVALLRSWIVRFNEDYLMQQTFFEPYPVELVEITDSGKGRTFSR